MGFLKSGFIKKFRVEPGSRVDLRKYTTDWTGTKEAKRLGKSDELKERSIEVLEENKHKLAESQELIQASDSHSVLLIFQAMDAAGKDGTIRHVMSGVNPQGCQVFSFKKPSAEELDHNFLWRYMKSLPERGRFGIFNRSYYEDVLVVKVHPEYLDEPIPKDMKPAKFWERRYDDINNFERHLTRNGTIVLKFFLHISKDEQRRRFLDRLSDEAKYWKFSVSDMEERKYWKEYQGAFEDALSATSTKWAPWYVIPADRKYVTRALVADIVVKAVHDLDLKYPEPGKEDIKRFAIARAELEKEQGGKNGRSKNGKKKERKEKKEKSKRPRKKAKAVVKPESVDAALASAQEAIAEGALS